MLEHSLMMNMEFIETMLSRQNVSIGQKTRQHFAGKTVMVTGGGSIGSYLCKVLVDCGVKVLIIYEKNEYNLYVTLHLLGESKTVIIPLLGDVLDVVRLDMVFKIYSIDYVFHTAAYKHVTMVERNVYEGLKNNVFGTLALINMVAKYKIPNFLMVSSDKAVRPTSIMGASKRIAENIVLTTQGSCKRQVVRFGNVLWSSGSVLPLFKKQLLSGQPVTLTDENVTRYFMSVKEAILLILKTAMIDQSGVFVFEMKDPIKIKDMVDRLAGFLGVKEYQIKLIGLRTGEKLYEELTLGEGLVRTKVKDIFYVTGEQVAPMDYILPILRRLMEDNKVNEIRKLLDQLDIGYNSDGGVVDELWLESYVRNVDSIYGDAQSYFWEALKNP
jgi:FlaA1/EpsC-like NDP-sugar epimerase